MTATIAGRSIDQGVLAQLVIEDTDIRSVHTLNVPAPATASVTSGKVEPAGCPATVSIIEHVHNLVALDANGTKTVTAEEAIIDFDQPLSFKDVFDQPVSINRITVQDIACTQHAKSDAGCESTCPAAGHAKAADAEKKKAGLHASGEESCSADDEANAAECHGSQAASSPAEKATWSPTRSAQVQIPEIGHAEIAGEWLIPRDELLLVGFGPHTVADKDGKAVVRERLALITAEEVALPTASTSPEFLELPRSLPRVAVSPPRLAIPAIPSRSLPQGVHADGTPAELPPLPDEEKADPSPSPGDSSEPRPSPQTKKPHPGDGPGRQSDQQTLRIRGQQSHQDGVRAGQGPVQTEHAAPVHFPQPPVHDAAEAVRHEAAVQPEAGARVDRPGRARFRDGVGSPSSRRMKARDRVAGIHQSAAE